MHAKKRNFTQISQLHIQILGFSANSMLKKEHCRLFSSSSPVARVLLYSETWTKLWLSDGLRLRKKHAWALSQQTRPLQISNYLVTCGGKAAAISPCSIRSRPSPNISPWCLIRCTYPPRGRGQHEARVARKTL
jgi:hypothetical protein